MHDAYTLPPRQIYGPEHNMFHCAVPGTLHIGRPSLHTGFDERYPEVS